LFALNLVCWNSQELPTAVLTEVLEGAAQVGTECGYVTVGGHTVEDPEPKFGLAVVGEVHPGRLLSNKGLRAGDALVLTKRLGTGIIATAIKRGAAPDWAAAAAVESMTTTNAVAAGAALAGGATGGTDVTGFGLLGHLGRMADASGVDVSLDVGAIQVLPGARELAEKEFIPGGTRRNLDWVNDQLTADGTAGLEQLILADAQTSGGLLFGVTPDRAPGVVDEITTAGVPAAVVGTARSGTGRIHLQ
jgi:selenide,water dikinase